MHVILTFALYNRLLQRPSRANCQSAWTPLLITILCLTHFNSELELARSIFRDLRLTHFNSELELACSIFRDVGLIHFNSKLEQCSSIHLHLQFQNVETLLTHPLHQPGKMNHLLNLSKTGVAICLKLQQH